MRYLLVVCCLLSCTAFSQTKADHERVMERFKTFYNNNRVDSIINMFSKGERDEMADWLKNAVSGTSQEYGRILSYKYLGVDKTDPGKVTVFIVNWSKGGQKTFSFNLDKNNEFGTFRMVTTSPGIEEMVRKAK